MSWGGVLGLLGAAEDAARDPIQRPLQQLAELLQGAPIAAETVAITGATLETMGPAGTIENGTLVIADGRIAAVGAGLPVPAGARRIDARGRVVTPGLFNSATGLGVVEVSAVEGTNDNQVKSDRITAAFDVGYATPG